jgi:hypothetical protein
MAVTLMLYSNEDSLKSLVQMYPDAEAFFLWVPEAYLVCRRDDEHRRLCVVFRGLRDGTPPPNIS